jgi:hypothetical protein
MDTGSVSRTSTVVKKRLHVVAYTCQVLAIFTVIVACLINLSIGDDKSALWSALLSGALGYLLPAPKLRNYESLLPNTSQQQLDEVLSRQQSHTIYDSSPNDNRTDGRMGSGTCRNDVHQDVVHYTNEQR